MPFKNKATLRFHAGVIRKCKLVIGEKISDEIGYAADKKRGRCGRNSF